MSTETFLFGDEPQPDSTDMLTLIRDAMWTCHQAIDSQEQFCTPAERFLPALRSALELIKNTLTEAMQGLPPDCQRALRNEGRRNASPKWTLKDRYPEIARACKLEVAVFALEYIIHDFETEGRPVRYLPTCGCGHNLSQHDRERGDCLECQCQAFVAPLAAPTLAKVRRHH